MKISENNLTTKDLTIVKTIRGFAISIEEAYSEVEEITDQYCWVENNCEMLDIFIGKRDRDLAALDGYKYHYLIKIEM